MIRRRASLVGRWRVVVISDRYVPASENSPCFWVCFHPILKKKIMVVFLVRKFLMHNLQNGFFGGTALVTAFFLGGELRTWNNCIWQRRRGRLCRSFGPCRLVVSFLMFPPIRAPEGSRRPWLLKPVSVPQKIPWNGTVVVHGSLVMWSMGPMTKMFERIAFQQIQWKAGQFKHKKNASKTWCFPCFLTKDLSNPIKFSPKRISPKLPQFFQKEDPQKSRPQRSQAGWSQLSWETRQVNQLQVQVNELQKLLGESSLEGGHLLREGFSWFSSQCFRFVSFVDLFVLGGLLRWCVAHVRAFFEVFSDDLLMFLILRDVMCRVPPVLFYCFQAIGFSFWCLGVIITLYFGQSEYVFLSLGCFQPTINARRIHWKPPQLVQLVALQSSRFPFCKTSQKFGAIIVALVPQIKTFFWGISICLNRQMGALQSWNLKLFCWQPLRSSCWFFLNSGTKEKSLEKRRTHFKKSKMVRKKQILGKKHIIKKPRNP